MKSAVLKHTLNAVGLIAVVLAIAGLFLPLLPTTPFLLLASACFARGSERLHGRLLANRHFGSLIRDFEQGKGIPLKGKLTAVALLWMSLSYSIYLAQRIFLVFLLLGIGIAVTVYLLRFVPTRPAAG